MKIKNLIKYLLYSMPWLAIVVTGILLLVQHTDFLYRSQEQSLFLPTKLFFEESTFLPGGWLTYGAAFLTQFFYYPVLGIAMLMLIWGVSVFLFAKGMKLRWELAGLLSLLPISLYSAISQIGYSLFFIKLQGLLVVPTLAVLVISFLLYLSSLLKGYWQTAFIAVVGLVAYPMMGAYGLLAPFVLAVWSERKPVNIIVSIAISFVSCMIFYYTHSTVMMNQMVFAALPSLYISMEYQHIYAIPYVALLAGFILPLVTMLHISEKIQKYSVFVVLAISVGVLLRCNYNNNNFRREQQIYRAMDNGDWDGVLRAADDSKKLYNPTRQIVFFRDMALWRKGILGEYAFTYINETQRSKSPFELATQKICASQQYYCAGMPYLAYRWAMESCVSEGWDVEGLKNLIRSSIAVGEYDIAKRYINVLRETMFHKDWAEYYNTLATQPALIKTLDKDISWVRSLLYYRNSLEVEDGNTANNIFEYYSKSTINDTKVQEMGLLSAMIKRDHKLFFERFVQYVTLNQDLVKMPKHYQEAALLMAYLDGNQEMLNQPYSEEVKREFEQFKRAYQSVERLPREQQSAMLWQRFGRTYYYYYTLNMGII